MIEITTLINMQVVMGKYKVKFSFFTIMSPGKRPKCGILLPIVKNMPIIINNIPTNIKDLPIAFISFYQ